LSEVLQIQYWEAELLKIKSARALMSSSQNPVKECEGGGSLLILTSKGATVNKKRGDVIFPSVMVSVGELGKNLTPSNVGSAEFVDKFAGYLRRRMLCFVRRQHS
jgi:hypothetical protein